MVFPRGAAAPPLPLLCRPQPGTSSSPSPPPRVSSSVNPAGRVGRPQNQIFTTFYPPPRCPALSPGWQRHNAQRLFLLPPWAPRSAPHRGWAGYVKIGDGVAPTLPRQGPRASPSSLAPQPPPLPAFSHRLQAPLLACSPHRIGVSGRRNCCGLFWIFFPQLTAWLATLLALGFCGDVVEGQGPPKWCSILASSPPRCGPCVGSRPAGSHCNLRPGLAQRLVHSRCSGRHLWIEKP